MILFNQVKANKLLPDGKISNWARKPMHSWPKSAKIEEHHYLTQNERLKQNENTKICHPGIN
jgi:hypothetical protein